VQRVDEGTRSRLLNIRGWRGFNNPWMPLDEEDVDFSYINLQQNPERYTGYKVTTLASCVVYTQHKLRQMLSSHKYNADDWPPWPEG
jgi:Endoplasmic Reticulum Oxidoreductin 1 (ERO1)